MTPNSMRPRWQKVLADLWATKSRTLLVVASIAVGVFAVGAIAATYGILSQDVNVSYMQTQPANITIVTDPFDDTLVRSVERVEGVGSAEGRHYAAVRVSKDGALWDGMELVAAEDFAENEINLVSIIEGSAELDDGELSVRSDIFNDSGLSIGETAFVELIDGRIRELNVVATVADQSMAGDFAASPRGYISFDTLEDLGAEPDYNRLLITVDGDGGDEVFIDEVAASVEEKLERAGYTIYRTSTAISVEHPMADLVLAILGVLGALGVLIMLLSASLIVNTLNALLNQHMRQIGVMKLVGARSTQISSMYIALIIAYGVIALIIAVPLGILAGYGLASFISNMMGIELQGFRIIPWAIVIQVLIAFLIPLGAGYFPVNRGAKTTVRRAISTGDIGGEQAGGGMLDRLGIWFKWLTRPILLSIRNTFRRKGRLALTLFTLTMAGAIFIAVFNVRDSLNSFIEDIGQHFLADVTITLEQPVRVVQMEQDLALIPGVKSVEGWSRGSGEVVEANDEVSAEITLFAPPSDSTLVQPDLIAGRWLEPGDTKTLVVSDAIYEDYPDIEPGDMLNFSLNGAREEPWEVVGIFRFADMLGVTLGYAPYEEIARQDNAVGQASSFRVVADATSLEAQQELSAQIDELLKARGYKVGDMEAGLFVQQQNAQSINILVIFLMAMALLTAFVGSIGLAGTMGMNVLERTREIGVMRAIGAVDGEIIKSVVIEGMMIGFISWLIAVVLSFPISFVLLRIISTAIFNAALPLAVTPIGFIVWFLMVMTLSVAASILPARNAARLTIREVLAYE